VGGGVYAADKRPGRTEGANRIPVVAFLKLGFHPAPIFAYEVDVIQQELAKAGFGMTYSVVETAGEVAAAAERIQASTPRGLVFFPRHGAPGEAEAWVRTLRRCLMPVLVLESRSAVFDYVTADTERGTVVLADYLYDLGHRSICLATVFPRKVAGFERALNRWKDPSVRHWIMAEEGKTDEHDRALARRILGLTPRPTAVIASDDHGAAVLISSFRETGVRVPDDVSVVAFDDHPTLAKLSPVPLTVLRHPSQAIAEEVVGWVVRQETAARARRLRREITGALVARDSTAPPGAHTRQPKRPPATIGRCCTPSGCKTPLSSLALPGDARRAVAFDPVGVVLPKGEPQHSPGQRPGTARVIPGNSTLKGRNILC
jgi:LacI family transcriptional regulator